MMLVDNADLRRAVAAFAAEPGQPGVFEVLRTSLCGDLLLDITGSQVRTEGGQVGAGSALQVRTGTGPDGGRALFAFTRNEEIARMYPPGTRTESLGTPAAGVLQMSRDNGDSWLYIDPAGPTCALAAADLDFALRVPRNDGLKAALAALDTGRSDRLDVLAALRVDGPLLLAADGASAPTGTLDRPTTVAVRTTTLPDGSRGLLAHTSAPEIAVRDPTDAIVSRSTTEVLDMVRDNGYGGLVINPAGPWIAFAATELFG